MEKVAIKRIVVGLIPFTVDNSEVVYENGQGVLDSNDDILMGYIRDSKKIYVVKDNDEQVKLDYKVDVAGKRVLINNPASELA
ncbi:hypothetical protein ACQW5G_02400 [Fructilactobacillus sp. Tb1]|uniref:hypothetical protein n=1 Tax=Fructilactobacillus sp. Tb1 TaxID=3422304 RepID=UPI003D29A159